MRPFAAVCLLAFSVLGVRAGHVAHTLTGGYSASSKLGASLVGGGPRGFVAAAGPVSVGSLVATTGGVGGRPLVAGGAVPAVLTGTGPAVVTAGPALVAAGGGAGPAVLGGAGGGAAGAALVAAAGPAIVGGPATSTFVPAPPPPSTVGAPEVVALGAQGPRVHEVHAQSSARAVRVEEFRGPRQVVRVLEGGQGPAEVVHVKGPHARSSVVRLVTRGGKTHVNHVVHQDPRVHVVTVQKQAAPGPRVIHVVRGPGAPTRVEHAHVETAAPTQIVLAPSDDGGETVVVGPSAGGAAAGAGGALVPAVAAGGALALTGAGIGGAALLGTGLAGAGAALGGVVSADDVGFASAGPVFPVGASGVTGGGASFVSSGVPLAATYSAPVTASVLGAPYAAGHPYYHHKAHYVKSLPATSYATLGGGFVKTIKNVLH